MYGEAQLKARGEPEGPTVAVTEEQGLGAGIAEQPIDNTQRVATSAQLAVQRGRQVQTKATAHRMQQCQRRETVDLDGAALVVSDAERLIQQLASEHHLAVHPECELQ